MAERKYFQEHIDYLREITPGRRSPEVTKLFNERFGFSASEVAVRTLRLRHGIRLTVPRTKRQYTDKQIDYLRELSERGLFNREITRLFNERFRLKKTELAIQSQRTLHNFTTTARHCWPKGHKPWNAGRKGVSYPGMKATQYEPGHRPHNWVPLGSERITRDGYVQVKVRDLSFPDCKKNWKGKQIIVWERHHGQKVPPGYAVIFGDQDKRNFNPDNLILVSRAQLATLNKNGLIQRDAGLTRTGLLIANVLQGIAKRKKERS